MRGALTLATKRTSSGGAYNPTSTLGAALYALWNVMLPYTFRFRPVRKLVRGSSQYFSRASSGAGDPFHFQGSGASKMMVEYWFRFDDDTGTLLTKNGMGLIGVSNGATNTRWSWKHDFATNGASASLGFLWGTTANGSFANSVTFTNCFNPSAVMAGEWIHVVFIYDGSQSGDANICKLYVNGVKQNTPAGSFPAQLGNPASGQGVTFSIGKTSAIFPSISFTDVRLCAAVPANSDNAAADLYNNGQGIRSRGDIWPTSCPTRMACYPCDDNATDNGTAPSGDMVDIIGGYNLTATAVPTGSLQIMGQHDVTGSYLMRYGHSPITGYAQRNLEAEYLPTARAGRPGIYCPGPRRANAIGGAYGYFGGIDFKALMGNKGSLFGSAIANTTSTSVDWLSVCDDISNRGNGAGGQDRRLSLSTIWNNLALIAAGNKAFANLHTFNGSGNPITYTPGDPCDIENLNGNEVNGTPVPGANYPAVGDMLTMIATNKHDGSSGGGSTAGPYELLTSLNGAAVQDEVVYVDDGGAGISGDIWASRSAALSCIVLNGLVTVVGGVWTPSSVMAGTYGSFGILGSTTHDQRVALGNWLATAA